MLEGYKESIDYLAKLEQSYGNFTLLTSAKNDTYDLAIKFAFFNSRAYLDLYKDYDPLWGSERWQPPLFNIVDWVFLFGTGVKLVWHYKWLVRYSKTFYYNYQRFEEVLLYFEFHDFVLTWTHENPTKEVIDEHTKKNLEDDYLLIARLMTDKIRSLRTQFPVLKVSDNKEIRFPSDAEGYQWFFESYAFRHRSLISNIHLISEFKAIQKLPFNYYFDLLFSFVMLMDLLYDKEHVFGFWHDLTFIFNYYILSSLKPLLAALQIRYSYYYFVEKNRETIFKDLYIYWFGKPLKKNKKYGHIFYLVRHKEKQFLYYIALTINFTDKNFSDENIALDYKDPVIQNELEDRLILQHYTLNVDTTHFDDSLQIPQVAILNITLDYFSSNLSKPDFEKNFLHKYCTKNKIMAESANLLEKDFDFTCMYRIFSVKNLKLPLPEKFEDNDSRFIEVDYKFTYDRIEWEIQQGKSLEEIAKRFPREN